MDHKIEIHTQIKYINVLNLSKLSLYVDQFSSLSLEDQQDAEPAYPMRELTPRSRHTFPSQEIRMMDRDPDGRICPHTPGTSAFMRRVGRNLQDSEPDLLHRCHFTSTSSLESSLSPSPSQNPWTRLDPYDSPEVMFEIFKMETKILTWSMSRSL